LTVKTQSRPILMIINPKEPPQHPPAQRGTDFRVVGAMFRVIRVIKVIRATLWLFPRSLDGGECEPGPRAQVVLTDSGLRVLYWPWPP
jgi:hypothetical protein